jgi:hypothetical protein
MTDKFKVGDLVVYIPKSGEIIESQITKIKKIQDSYIYVCLLGFLCKIKPESIHHYPLISNEKKFEIEI